jgi:putative spermidine/putrescine transport system substrate-binding protein
MLALLLSVAAVVDAQSDEITIASWGGLHTQSLLESYYDPFTLETRIVINSLHYAGGLSQLRNQVQTNSVLWDVVDMSAADVVDACDEGLLERLPLDQLSPGPELLDAADDFLPESLSPCAVGYSIWSMLLAYDKHQFAGAPPSKIVDLFDLERLPGKRGLYRSPRGSLEWALLAEGVEVADIYSQLSTEAGLARAFAKLQRIKHAIVWWQEVDEMEELLDSGEVVMGAAYNTAMFDAIFKRNRDFGVAWNSQILNFNYFVVPRGTHQFVSAWNFIRFATAYNRMAMISNLVAYGVTRRSAHSQIHSEYLAYFPSKPEHLTQGLYQDQSWWREHGEVIDERFVRWLSTPPN